MEVKEINEYIDKRSQEFDEAFDIIINIANTSKDNLTEDQKNKIAKLEIASNKDFEKAVENIVKDSSHPPRENTKSSKVYLYHKERFLQKNLSKFINKKQFPEAWKNVKNIKEYREKLLAQTKSGITHYHDQVMKTFGKKDNNIETSLDEIYEGFPLFLKEAYNAKNNDENLTQDELNDIFKQTIGIDNNINYNEFIQNNNKSINECISDNYKNEATQTPEIFALRDNLIKYYALQGLVPGSEKGNTEFQNAIDERREKEIVSSSFKQVRGAFQNGKLEEIIINNSNIENFSKDLNTAINQSGKTNIDYTKFVENNQDYLQKYAQQHNEYMDAITNAKNNAEKINALQQIAPHRNKLFTKLFEYTAHELNGKEDTTTIDKKINEKLNNEKNKQITKLTEVADEIHKGKINNEIALLPNNKLLSNSSHPPINNNEPNNNNIVALSEKKPTNQNEFLINLLKQGYRFDFAVEVDDNLIDLLKQESTLNSNANILAIENGPKNNPAHENFVDYTKKSSELFNNHNTGVDQLNKTEGIKAAFGRINKQSKKKNKLKAFLEAIKRVFQKIKNLFSKKQKLTTREKDNNTAIDIYSKNDNAKTFNPETINLNIKQEAKKAKRNNSR